MLSDAIHSTYNIWLPPEEVSMAAPAPLRPAPTLPRTALLIAVLSMASAPLHAQGADTPTVVQSAMTVVESTTKPTIVLVHGAFADASSWNGVTAKLQDAGYPVIAIADPLRSVKNDADTLALFLKTIKGSVVLVGHSYAGMVISNAVHDNTQVKALVFVAALAPQKDEAAGQLVGQFPGSTLGASLAAPVDLGNNTHDLYIQQDKFRATYAADVPTILAKSMAATQRPIADVALGEKSGTPAWRVIPSYFVFGTLDKSIPPAAHRFMAERAKGREIIEVRGASHAVMVSNPTAVTNVILDAARSIR